MKFEQKTGITLILGSVLLVVTMVLHPAGGNFEHLLKASKMIVIAHSLAIVSMPVCLLGFWGLTKKLGTENFLSALAMAFMLMGLISGMCAAAINGLALPIYVNYYKDATAELIETIRHPLRYGSSLNLAFDYIFIGAVCIAVTLWSIVVLQTKKLAAWLGYFGIALTIVSVNMMLSGFVFTSLYGFRLFVFGLVGWIVWGGILLVKQKQIE